MAFQEITFAEALSTPGIVVIQNDIVETVRELNAYAVLHFLSCKAYAVGDVHHFMHKHSLSALRVIYTDTFEKAEHLGKTIHETHEPIKGYLREL